MKRILIILLATFFAQSLFSQVVRDQVPRMRVIVEVGTDVTG